MFQPNSNMPEIPPDVARWLAETFDVFILTGFDCEGRVVEVIKSQSAMHKMALMESLRQSIQANQVAIPVSVEDQSG